MANTVVIFLSLYIYLSIMSPISVTIAKPAGLSIKLIHRDSPESPLYNPNLTQSQRTQKLILLTKARMQDLKNHKNSNPNVVRPKVDYQRGVTYMAQVSIGTFSRSQPITYFLDMDTGSSLIWIQCKQCKDPGRHCFYQKKPIFPDSQSSSYQRLTCNRGHPLCFPRECMGDFCSYQVQYADNSGSAGYLASETFTFDSNSSGRETYRMVFGCGINQKGMGHYGEDGGYVAGILGLGWSPHSLVMQLGSSANRRFSYCLQKMPLNYHNSNTYLRFGADIPSRPGLQQTELVQFRNWPHYYLNMEDISVAGSRLRIPEQNVTTLIDSGCAYTGIAKPAFRTLEQGLVNYFANNRNVNRILRHDFDLCYQRKRPEGFKNLPTITFHFKGGANLVVQPPGGFVVKSPRFFGREYFCLAMFANQDNVIGAYQQTNQRFIYDLNTKTLHFGPEDCTRNP